MLRSAKGKGI